MKYFLIFFIFLLFLYGCTDDCSTEQTRINELTDKLIAYKCDCPICPTCPVCKTTIAECQPFIDALNVTQKAVPCENKDTNSVCYSFIKQISRLESSLDDCYELNETNCTGCTEDLDICEQKLENISEII